MKAGFYIFVVVMAGSLLAVGISNGAHVFKLKFLGEWTVGVVVNSSYTESTANNSFSYSNRYTNPSSPTILFAPNIIFLDENGNRHFFTSDVSSSDPYAENESVIVYYDPKNPDDAIMKDSSWLFSVCFVTPGILLLWLGIVQYRKNIFRF